MKNDSLAILHHIHVMLCTFLKIYVSIEKMSWYHYI